MSTYSLHADAALDPVESDLPKEVNGQPAAYFWADAIRAGRYVHPAGRFELHVDRGRIDAWVANFHRMKANGVDVPVPVDHSASARDNLGYVVDARREGDALRVLHQLIGEDAIRLAARNKVSLGIDPQFRDGRGTAYGDCVVHSSLTPVPLVPGQGALVAMSAEPGDGAAGERGMVFHLTAAATRDLPAEEPALLGAYADLYARRLEDLVASARITPACRDGLVELLKPRGHGMILLSRADRAGGDGERLIDGLIAALGRNRAIDAADRTGVQTLQRAVPGEASTVDPQLQQTMVRLANGG